MTMPFDVHDAKELDGLAPGAIVSFKLVVDQDSSYAENWKADPKTWHFLTAEVADVEKVTSLFGMDYFPEEGLNGPFVAYRNH